jgi:transposase
MQGFDRNQLQMLSFDEFVKQNSWARVVDLFVEGLPIDSLGFKHEHATEGRPPYAAADLLKLFLYGYKNQLRSSRKLAHACEVNMEVIWLMKGLRPSARKIAYFRKDNAKAFKQVFRYFVVILKDMNLIDGQTIAIDSFKIRAQNALKNNFNQKKIDRHIEYIDSKIQEYEQAIDQADSEDQKQELAAKIDYQKSKKDTYQYIEKQLQESGETQISLVDPDAKSVVLHRNIINVGYCVQAGCDSKHNLFINNDTGTVNDTHALSPMALDAKELLQLKTMNVLTDKGYTTGKHIDICTKNNIITFSSPKAHSSQKNGLFDMQIFEYNKQDDFYTCPANKKLVTNGTVYNKANHKVKHYKNREACKSCELTSQCTANKNGRFIERSIYQEALENNQQRVNSNPNYYRLRQQITEHQFGTLKRQWGFTFTLMKGKNNVLSEVNLMMICYNLKRLMSILSPNDLKNRLKGLVAYFFVLYAIILAPLRSKIQKTTFSLCNKNLI